MFVCWHYNAMGLVDDEYVFFETWHFCIAIHNLLSTAAWQCLCIYIFVSMHDILREKKLIKTFFGIYHHYNVQTFQKQNQSSILRLEKRKDELKFNFWMPDSLFKKSCHMVITQIYHYQCDQEGHFLAGWTTEAGC